MKTKRMNISLVALILLIMLPMVSFAQPGFRGQERRERIEVQKIAFITDKLQLTPAEAQVFWPLYNEYDAKRDEIMQKLRTRNRELLCWREDMSEEEAGKLADDLLVEEQMLLDLRKEYHVKYQKVLPATKILKLYHAEREFKRVLIEKIRGPRRP